MKNVLRDDRRNQEVEVLTLREAASYLRVSERTLWQAVQDGEVQCVKIRGQYRFLKSQLRRQVMGQQD